MSAEQHMTASLETGTFSDERAPRTLRLRQTIRLRGASADLYNALTELLEDYESFVAAYGFADQRLVDQARAALAKANPSPVSATPDPNDR